MISQINFEDMVIADIKYVNNTTESIRFEVEYAPVAPVYLYTSAMSLACVSAFLKAGFILKTIMMLLFIAIQTSILWTSNLFDTYKILYDSWPLAFQGLLLLLLIAIILLFMESKAQS